MKKKTIGFCDITYEGYEEDDYGNKPECHNFPTILNVEVDANFDEYDTDALRKLLKSKLKEMGVHPPKIIGFTW